MNHDVFISYSSKNPQVALAVCHLLEEHGIKCWMAPRNIPPGSDFGDLIDDAIKASKVFLFIYSFEYVNSKWCQGELNIAFSEEKIIIPYRIDTTPIKGAVRVMLNQRHWLDAYPDYQSQFTSLVEAVNRSLGKTMVPTSTPTKKVEDEKPITIESKIIQANGVEFKMIKVDGGTFNMGSIDGCTDEQPIHQVTLSDYYIAETQVTQEIWNSVMGNNPSNFKNEKSPVENVSWENCQAFIEKLNSITDCCFRLPTEAEWEYAARGGKYSKGYIYSGSNNIEEVAWWWENSNKTTHPVKTKKPNELGIYDMSGNVWEWCEDDNSKYQPESVMDPLIQDNSSSKIERGGCWDDNWGDTAKSCRVSYRSSDWKTYSSKRIGFRLAMSTVVRIKDQEQATKEFPQTIKIPFDDKSFNMLLSADKSYYIGCVTDTKNEYKWLKSNSSIKISHVAIAVSTIIFPIPALIAFLSYCFFSSDDKERDKTQFIVNENLCNRISNDIKFAVPQTHELKDVKEEEKKYCIVIRISDNPKLHDFLAVTNAKN